MQGAPLCCSSRGPFERTRLDIEWSVEKRHQQALLALLSKVVFNKEVWTVDWPRLLPKQTA